MPLIYITGISGSGKSTLRSELLQRGYEAHGTDEDDIAGFYNNETDKLVESPKNLQDRTREWQAHHTWKMSRQKIEELIHHATTDKPIFLCGATANDVDMWELFHQVFALHISENILKHRIITRTSNDYGKLPHEFESILKWHKTAEKEYRELGAIIINGEKPITTVVNDILNRID